MALLAESLVDEWLNRQGFFTVRGIKHGVDEIDLLGIRPKGKSLEAWHVEVQASFRPIGYISPLTDEFVPSFAKSKRSAKARPLDVLKPSVAAWVNGKFLAPEKKRARDSAWPGLDWRFVLVHAVVREPQEMVPNAARALARLAARVCRTRRIWAQESRMRYSPTITS
jgi:hypothetical protein